MSKFIMVLNDGETFTDLQGCAIVEVADDASTESIEAQLDADDGTDYVATFNIRHGVIEWWSCDNHLGTIPT